MGNAVLYCTVLYCTVLWLQLRFLVVGNVTASGGANASRSANRGGMEWN